ncbi:MAG: polyphosphate polymerase domain-containing protein [Gemmatimonadota bacterium]
MKTAFRLPDFLAIVAGPGAELDESGRRELKYLLRGTHEQAADAIRCRLPSLRPHHPPRRVSSVYFDTPGYASYAQSNAGLSERLKLRLRWYGALLPETRPILEIKTRAAERGWKRQMELPAIDLTRITWSELRRFLAAAVNGDDRLVVSLLSVPVLIASYTRNYFVSANRRVRVTVDTGLRYHDQRLRSTVNTAFDAVRANVSVLECKMSPSDQAQTEAMLRPLGVRQTRFSKYCHGVELLSRR